MSAALAEPAPGCLNPPVSNPPADPASPSTFALLLLGAAVALGHALQLNNGMLRPDAIAFLTVALVLSFAALFAARVGRLERWSSAALPLLVVAGVFVQVGQLFTAYPAFYVRLGREELIAFYWLLAALGTSGAALAYAPARWPRHLLIAALVVAHFALGRLLIEHSPAPAIDVDVFHREGLRALFAGDNPYAITIPNIYGHSHFYGEGLVVGDRLHVGFPYPPLSLLFSALARALAGDHRYALLVAMELAAVLGACARPGRSGVWAAALFLTTPRFLFVLEAGWTEPFVVAGVGAVLFVAHRAPRALPWIFGLFLGTKQFTVLAVPASALLARWPLQRRPFALFWGKALLVVVAVMAPFFLWSPGAFLHSVVEFQVVQPFRPDSLSYLAWFHQQGGPAASAAWGFGAAGIAAAVALWRAPRSPAGFAATFALTLFAFVAFNKQAFANYYYLIVGLLCVAAAAAGSNAEPITAESAPRALAPAPAKV